MLRERSTRVFDIDRDGMLGCGELWAALEWLGLPLTVADVHAVMRCVDRQGDGRLRCEWVGVVRMGWREDGRLWCEWTIRVGFGFE